MKEEKNKLCWGRGRLIKCGIPTKSAIEPYPKCQHISLRIPAFTWRDPNKKSINDAFWRMSDKTVWSTISSGTFSPRYLIEAKKIDSKIYYFQPIRFSTFPLCNTAIMLPNESRSHTVLLWNLEKFKTSKHYHHISIWMLIVYFVLQYKEYLALSDA